MIKEELEKFIQSNSPDGGFLQSEYWRKFQEAVGHKTFTLKEGDFSASIIEHQLPIVVRYFYVPRGPVLCHPDTPVGGEGSRDSSLTLRMTEILNLAKNNNAGWVRLDPENEEILNAIKNSIGYKIVKAPHDMQPRQIFVMDITKSEEELLAEMKSKTRYNIKVAQKHGVSIKVISNASCHPERNEGSRDSSDLPQNDNISEFIRLTKIMAKRQGITAHPDGYYLKMFETIPGEILKLYVAEYQDKIVAANIMVFYRDVCTYLHGAFDDEYKNLMAPYLLQWQAIKDSKASGCTKYDFGGVKVCHPERSEGSRDSSDLPQNDNAWEGITRFKLGFSPETKPIEFPGSYDIVIDRRRYYLYRIMQKIKCWIE